MIAETLFCLAQAVYFEARSQPLIEQVAVAQVVLNRVYSERYPNTVCDVVYENHFPKQLYKCQFSFMCDGLKETITDADAWLESNQVASLVLQPSFPDLVDGSVNYHADYVRPDWSSKLNKVAQIGRHVFYR